MVKGFKHCCDLDNSTVTIFNDHFGGNWVGKSLFYWDAKPYNCLLKHWLLMRSILFLIEAIQRKQFGCNYLKNKKSFLIFPCIFKIYIKFWIFSKKKTTVIADSFPKLRTPKNVVRYICKKSRLKGPFDRQYGKRVQTLFWSERQHRYHIYWSFWR